MLQKQRYEIIISAEDSIGRYHYEIHEIDDSVNTNYNEYKYSIINVIYSSNFFTSVDEARKDAINWLKSHLDDNSNP
ncbi:hypothetical protein F4X73_02270 [Candidatus Poribacteria bacterium]|nr:hypothetical protein [Candidatus Poribacteria bacterium]